MVDAPIEYNRKCKQAGCEERFVVSGLSLGLDRMLAYSAPEYCPAHRARHARSYSRIAMHHPDATESAWGREQLAQAVANLGPGGIGRLDRGARPFEQKTIKTVAPNFPIAEKDDEILAKLGAHQVLVLVGPTGSGKSTHVPHLLLRSQWSRRGPIVVTQPRIQATRQIPDFVAQLNGSSYGPGAEIGFCHSGTDQYDRRTRLLFMTDGKLINDIVSGAIGNYSMVMIDEAHERSVNIDLIIGLMREQLLIYPHLRLIIASATINHASFVDFFGGDRTVGLVKSTGKFFPVKEHWWGEDDWWKTINGGELPERDDLPCAIADLVRYLWSAPNATGGHILAFLPGTREIDATVDRIRALQLPKSLVLPLYANRPLDEQQRALAPKSEADQHLRRVVVSTNVAETSLTVVGVRHIIDSGYIKETIWNPIGRVSDMRTQRHSKAGCKQRWGRAGRVEPGDAWLLYTHEQYDTLFPEHTAPGIARASMEEVVLTAAAAGLRDLHTFPWIPMDEEADNTRFRLELGRSLASLKQRNIINQYGDLTKFGLELRGLAGGLDQAMAFALGDRYAMGVEVATLLPFLKLEHGIQALLPREEELLTEVEDGRRERVWEIRENRLALFAGCEDDLDLFARLWIGWCRTIGSDRDAWCAAHGIDARVFRDTIEKEHERLLGSMADRRKSERRDLSIERLDALRALFACALPHAIYVRHDVKGSTGSTGISEMDDGYSLSETPGPECGIYRRLSPRVDETEAETLVEIIPSSAVASRPPTLCLVCLRKANFLRPARTAVIGMNILRLDPAWLPVINSDSTDALVERALLFARLSRRRPPAEHEANQRRLLLPLLLPVGAEMKEVRRATTPGCVVVGLHDRLYEGELELQFDGVPGNAGNANFSAQVLRYDGTKPILGPIGPRLSTKPLQQGRSVELRVQRILPCPVGRMPFFEVHEASTGSVAAMLPQDFSGNAPCHPEHGLRYRPGDHFQAKVVENDPLRFSCAETLLKDVLKIPSDWDGTVQPMRVHRIDEWGAWVLVGPYLALVKRGAWPLEREVQSGDMIPGRIRSRLRPADRALVEEAIREKESIPGGFALGYDVDLRAPEIFERFRQQYSRGSLVEAQVDRILDWGLVLVVGGQRIMIPESELGLDVAGNLRRARSYPLGSAVKAVIIGMRESTVSVKASIWKATIQMTPPSVGEVIRVRIVLLRSKPWPLCVGVTEDGHRIQLTGEDLSVGMEVEALITRSFADTGQIDAVVS